MLCFSCHFILLKPLALRMDHAKLLDVLTSLPVNHAILPRAVCFETSRPANNAICSFIDSSGYASGQIRICLFIDYIIIFLIVFGYIAFEKQIQQHFSKCESYLRERERERERERPAEREREREASGERKCKDRGWCAPFFK